MRDTDQLARPKRAKRAGQEATRGVGRETHNTLVHSYTLLKIRVVWLTYIVQFAYEGGERLQSWMQLVYGEWGVPVVVSANVSMYALGMLSFELQVTKLINWLHFHPVREDRQENS